ncbi:alanine--tRNA ligase [Betaproteobacteria bacterium PRO7]|nr:alanine--tRNA ligase [Betaproteobacteria bacterium PRO7]
MKSAEIRDQFLKFFESKGHTIVRASSLVPANDPTLLFVNSGMVQFKDVFTGREKRPYTRAATAQKSLRAGGKHNDLENVGYTARHHTFFEMLGNFSFGDYFKRDAIKYAWELLTEVYRLPQEKLWTTVYVDDDEAYDIWTKEIGVPKERCIRIGDKPGQPKYVSDNFWQMADTGPCGPCSEIFYDHGPEVAGGPPGSPDADGDRYIEIWNLVFMQFDRDDKGVLTPLPKPCVDTGMGLERLAAVLQHVHSNYEIDLFQNLISAAARETKTKDLSNNSLKVIADHIRACSFLIADGVIPGNEGRGYVLRRIIRRALRHGYKLGQTQPFFHKIVADLVKEMGDAYPELREMQARVEGVLKQEEERFGETLEHGMKILEGALGRLGSGDARMLDGETVFLLYDTYGFPVDLTADICRERGISVDHAGFEQAMERQREQARAAGKFRMAAGVDYAGAKTRFVGYDYLTAEAKVIGLYVDGTPVSEVRAGQNAIVVLDATPFYAESGGQVGDRGEIVGAGGTFEVLDTQKIQPDVFGHHGVLKTGSIEFGEKVNARVNVTLRTRAMHNHSATHLMHAALRQVLGPHVQQKGSLVDAERTRFDFSHDKPMTAEQIRKVEEIVNHAIRANAPVAASVMKFDDAIRAGALAFFGDKYGDEVRVITMADDGQKFSTELCGGTHVKRTGEIGFFKIVAEGGVAAGVRRVEAVTGAGALAYVQSLDAQLAEVAAALKAPAAEVTQKIAHLLDNVRSLEKEVARLKGKLASSQGDDLAAQAADVKGVKVLAATLEGADAKVLRDTIDQLKNKLKTAAIVLAAVEDGKVQLAAGVTADAVAKLKAGELVNFVAQQVGGKGGGRADMAMAGGTDPAKLPGALAGVRSWVEQRL